MLNSLEVTSRTPSMKKSQFHPSRKNLNLPENFLPPSRENCLTITETTSNNRTKSQPLPKKSQPLVKKYQPPTHQKKKFYPPENFSIPLKFLNPPEISQSLLKVSQPS